MYNFIFSSDDLREIDSAIVNFTPGGSSILCAIIGTVDDSIVEDNETYSFTFQSDDQAISGIVPSSGEITLLDNDSKQKGEENRVETHYFHAVALFEFNQSIYEVSEEPILFSVCVELQNAVSIDTNLTLHLQTEENTASTNDFVSINEERSIIGSTCFELSIISDNLLEGDEFFTFSINSRDTRLEINYPSTQIRIEDRNGKTFVIARQYFFANMLAIATLFKKEFV